MSQVSVVHRLWSSQGCPGPGTHAVSAQTSPVVHALLPLQALPSQSGSAQSASPSRSPSTPSLQMPSMASHQPSASASSHLAQTPWFTCESVGGRQPNEYFPSDQYVSPGTGRNPAGGGAQSASSTQQFETAAGWQLKIESQESVVQSSPSLQLSAAPGTHAPPAHASPLVHRSLSVHWLMLLTCWHPANASQESSVQRLLSSQLGATPATQPVALSQVSTPLHASLSLQTTGV